MPRPSSAYRLILPTALLVAASLPHAARAQSSTTAFTACGSGPLGNCALIQLTSQLGIGPGGLNLFEIAIGNLGSTLLPTTPTSIYNLILSTGAPAAPGGEIDSPVAPIALGGAIITDPSPWDVFDSGDLIFLSALSNNGVGGCVAGAAVGGFGEAGQTCGADQLFAFGFYTSRIYDPASFSVLDMETVGLTSGLPAESCGAGVPCAISAAPVTATPEPGTLILAVSGFCGIAVRVRSRRLRAGAPPQLVSREV